MKGRFSTAPDVQQGCTMSAGRWLVSLSAGTSMRPRSNPQPQTSTLRDCTAAARGAHCTHTKMIHCGHSPPSCRIRRGAPLIFGPSKRVVCPLLQHPHACIHAPRPARCLRKGRRKRESTSTDLREVRRQRPKVRQTSRRGGGGLAATAVASYRAPVGPSSCGGCSRGVDSVWRRAAQPPGTVTVGPRKPYERLRSAKLGFSMIIKGSVVKLNGADANAMILPTPRPRCCG